MSLEEMKTALEEQQPATLVALAERHLERDPGCASTLFKYADVLFDLGRHEEAFDLRIRMLDWFPRIRWVFCSELGGMERRRGAFKDAENWYCSVISERPDTADSYVLRGALLARRGELAEAEETHRLGTLCSSGCVDESYHNLGLVLRGQNRLEEAAECFRTAIEMDPDYECAIEALTDVETGIRLQRDGYEAPDSLPEKALPNELFVPKEIREAKRNSQAATVLALSDGWLQKHPDLKSVAFARAEMTYLLTQYDRAKVIYEGLLSGCPDDDWGVLNQLCKLSSYRGRLVEGKRYAREAIDLDPEEWASYDLLGVLHEREGRFDLAAELYCSAKERVDPEYNADLIEHRLGCSLRGLGKLAEARQCFERAVSLSPGWVLPRKDLRDVEQAIAIRGRTDETTHS